MKNPENVHQSLNIWTKGVIKKLKMQKKYNWQENWNFRRQRRVVFKLNKLYTLIRNRSVCSNYITLFITLSFPFVDLVETRLSKLIQSKKPAIAHQPYAITK